MMQSDLLVKLMFTGNADAPTKWGLSMCCPICSDDYVHITSLQEHASDEYSAWEGRGSAVRVHMSCEAHNHHWVLRFGFHKGNTFFAIERGE